MRYVIMLTCFLLLIVAPAMSELRLVIKDTIGKEWTSEPIYWDVSLKEKEWDGADLLVQRDGAPIPAQAYVTDRYADGSVKTARITFIIDRLEQDAATTITAQLNKTGPQDTDLSVLPGNATLVLANRYTAVKLPDGLGPDSSPILGVQTLSGKWIGGGSYDTQTAKPVQSQTELMERGPVRLVARVTTTFDNDRKHIVTVGLLAGSPEIDIKESFNLGPDEKYKFKEYKTDQDELAWEWWSWYGDGSDLKTDSHPNNWIFTLSSPEFNPAVARYSGEDRSTDDSKTDTGNGYDLTYAKTRMEKIVEPIVWWQPDAASWYAVSPSRDAKADAVGICTHTAREWRNPNVYPLTSITLRTRTNAMRVISTDQKSLLVQCPIGLGDRVWSIRLSDFAEAGPELTASHVQHCFGLDITRKWITDWDMTFDYPRLLIDPKEKEAYYARFKGVGMDTGQTFSDFMAKQDQDSFTRLYDETLKGMNSTIDSYYTQGLNGYPGWMHAYLAGNDTAAAMDNLLGSPNCTPEMARVLKKKMAILTYMLTSKDNWPDKQSNFGWGSMNMPVGRWGGLVTMASSISDHPMTATWLKDANRYFSMLLNTEWSPDGVQISCPHYMGCAIGTIKAWLIMANSGKGPDMSRSPVLKNFARYVMQVMTPKDPRWGIRTLLTEGDSRPGSSSFPAVLANFFKKTDPELAGQLMKVWIESGKDTGYDALIIDQTIPSQEVKLGPEVFPGFGAFLRYRQLGTPEEAYLSFLGGNFMIDHTNNDQLAFEWYEKGVPLTLYQGDLYSIGAFSSISHNTLVWDVRPEGPPTPGKDQPGDWYHDKGYPWAEHVNRPRLHWQIGTDFALQKITDTRGMVTYGVDQQEAALLEGQVEVMAMAEVPTRADYSMPMVSQYWPRAEALENPFTWTRRLLYVKAPAAAGMNYLVVKDDTGAYHDRTPNFNYWSLSEDVTLKEQSAHFTGQLGIDTDLFVMAPNQVKLYKDSFTHTECEPIVRSLGFTSEKQMLARVEGQPGQGFLVLIFPRKTDEPAPIVEPWQGEHGMKITWQGETHYVLLDVTPRTIESDGIKATAACLVVKVKDAKNFSISLPAGGDASYGGKVVTSTDSVELTVVKGKAQQTIGKNLLPAAK